MPRRFRSAGPPSVFAGKNSKKGLTKREKAHILNSNSKANRYDDREKVQSQRFRELPGAVRQHEAAGRHWPSSISAEAAARLRRKRDSSPLPERRDSSGRPDRCRKRAFFMPMRVVPRKFRLSSLLKRDEGFFCCHFKRNSGGTSHEAHQDF